LIASIFSETFTTTFKLCGELKWIKKLAVPVAFMLSFIKDIAIPSVRAVG
jgi:hypothetical protein